MEPIISTYIEEPPHPIFLIKPCQNPKNLHYNPIGLERVHKVVRFFSDDGDMRRKYYTESEWNDSHHIPFYRMEEIKAYTVLDHFTFLRYLNGKLQDGYINEFLADLDSECCEFTFDELAPASQHLIDAIREWTNKGRHTPFTYENLDCECDTVEGYPDEYEIYSFDKRNVKDSTRSKN